ncbi:MAG: alanyl-tRNA synthetase [Candidatus Poriferisodalaceae bacterium]|jgi:alanyl-tRNA synthetase
MDAGQLRHAFTNFWESKGHQPRPSASLIPHEPSLLFTVAGMVPFMPYFLGQEQPPSSRLTTIQKCVRAGGKHNDLDDIGRTNRHFTFFEMMGNFSFGDYFKADAIPWAYEFVTEVLGFDPEKLWVTVHVSDDDAEKIWQESVNFPAERIQRLDKDNWWAAGDTGPCGPCSEIFYDLGPEHGPDGGPAHGGEDRFIEVWNLVFMQFANDGTGELTPLPKTGIDTGAGMERLLAVLQGKASAWDIDLFQPLLRAAEEITGVSVGENAERDVSMRIFADHARAMTMLISDGVFPSNEDRGYVLRRIIRRAVRHAWVLGVTDVVMPRLVDVVVDVMGDAYPDLIKNQGFIGDVVRREEERFRRTLATGSTIVDNALAELAEGAPMPGAVAFQLHDTFGFPVEVTEEMLAEQGIALDRDGFDAAMAEQRERARAARSNGAKGSTETYKVLLDEHGVTMFERGANRIDDATVLAVEQLEDGRFEIFLDRTPFYAESGGQVGDTGTIESAGGRAVVVDCTLGLPGLHRHVATIDGELLVGDTVSAHIDGTRRDAVRRNHTGTHILHWALREVLGDHVQQAGSHVGDERLRFDFNHFEAVTDEQLIAIENMVNEEILDNGRCNHFETSMEHATELGAVAFFGDKYGDQVRVLEAGAHSLELCGGTHVNALGDIGHMRIVSESSIGSNMRRVEAITGLATVERLQADEEILRQAADLVGSNPDDLTGAIQRRIDEIKDLRSQIKALQAQAAGAKSGEFAAGAIDGVVVERVDGMDRDGLRDLACAIRDQPGIRAAVLAGAADGGGVALVAAVQPDDALSASALLRDAAKAVQGGFGGKGDPPLIMAGGRNVEAIDDALNMARAAAGLAQA